MAKNNLKNLLYLFLIIIFYGVLIMSIGCGSNGDTGSSDGGDEDGSVDLTGDAIIGLTVIDGGYEGTPSEAPEGYTLLPIDLNAGTGGHYIWLYYKMGSADGSQGTPIGDIYTVAEYDGEEPIIEDDIRLPVSLNGDDTNHPLWLYYSESSGSVVRGIVVSNESEGLTFYGPPEAEGKYDVVWVEELIPDEWKTPSEFPQPPDAQDLNEKQSFLFPPIFLMSDWIFLGYCVD